MTWQLLRRLRRPSSMRRLRRQRELNVEQFGFDRLEPRKVLSGLPIDGPSPAGYDLVITPGLDVSGKAVFGDFVYEVAGNTVTITAYTGSGGHVAIPTAIEWLPVTAIGPRAFESQEGLTSIMIPDSVTSIGSFAFSGCVNLAEVVMPPRLTQLGGWAFHRCEKLTQITLPPGLEEISIEVFSYCRSLKSIVVPEGVTKISWAAFCCCSDLASITLPTTLKSIGGYVFVGCLSLESLKIPDGVLSIGDWGIAGCNVAEITIPESVTTIGKFAFQGLANLRSIYIPKGVNSIGSGPFADCIKLVEIRVDPLNVAYSSLNGGLYSKDASVLLQWPTGGQEHAVIPDSVKGIGDRAFFGAAGLKSVKVPASVTSVGEWAFRGCSRLLAVDFEGAPPTVGSEIFRESAPTVYRLADSQGWSATFGDRPVAILQQFFVPKGWTVIVDQIEMSRVVKQGPGKLILEGSSSHRGGTAVDEGELVIRHSGALGGGPLELRGDSVQVRLETQVELMVIQSLSFTPNSRLDIGLSRVYVPAGGYESGPVLEMILSGRSGGTWRGESGFTSRYAMDLSGRSVGYAFSGSGALQMAVAAAGDANLDGMLDSRDLVEISAGGAFGRGSQATWQKGDFNFDGVVDIRDMVAMQSTGLYGKGSYLPQAETGSSLRVDPMFIFAALAHQADDE